MCGSSELGDGGSIAEIRHCELVAQPALGAPRAAGP